MNMITEAEFRKRLSAPLSGCYLFFGEEDYLKDFCLKAAREKICTDEGLAVFNDVALNFSDVAPDALADTLSNALSVPPMMSDCKIVTMRAMDFGALKPDDLKGLIGVLDTYREDPSNLLILSALPDGFDAGILPKKPSSLFKEISAVCTPVHFEPSTPAKLAGWAVRHFRHEGVEASDAVVRFLIDYCGTSMQTLSLEIGKLCAYVLANGRTAVTEQDVRAVAIPQVDCDFFALSNAILAGNHAEALSVLAVMKFRHVKPEYALAEISQIYCNLYQIKRLAECGMDAAQIGKVFHPAMHSYKVELNLRAARRYSNESLVRAIDLCADADLAMKTYAKRNYEQIEKLVCLL